MGDDAGELEVQYVVVSDAAVRRLERMQKQFDKVGDAAEKQGKKVEESYKKQIKAVAAYGAVVTGMLYGLIRASSYASMWMDQLKYTTMRLADEILELTGTQEAIDFFLSSFETLVDQVEDPEETTFWSDLADDFAALDTKAKLAAIGLGILATAMTLLGVALGLVGLNSLLMKLGLIAAGAGPVGTAFAWIAAKLVAVKAAIAGAITWFAAGSTAALLLAAAIGVLIGLIVVWLLKKTGILDWFATLGEKFREWDSWIKDIIMIITSPLTLLGAAIIDIVNGNLGFPLLKEGFETICGHVLNLKEKFFTYFTEMGEKFGTWVFGMGEKFGEWIISTKDKLNIFDVDVSAIFDGIYKYIIDGLTTMKDTFFGIITDLIDKVANLVSSILSIPSLPSWAGGGGGGGGGSSSFGTTEKSEREGDWGSANATGGHVLRTGRTTVHQGEDIVNLKAIMSGIRSEQKGSKEVIINNTINITGGNLTNPTEISRVANAISKRMGEEVYRISTSI